MGKLSTIIGIFKEHGVQRGSAISARILCNKFACNGLYGSITRALLKHTFNDAITALDELRCPFALAYGTALGVRRDGELIQHDGDVDFMITQDALLDISADPDERDHLINTAMRKHSFEFSRAHSAPWYYAPESWERRDHVPLLYQYIHTRTNVRFDAYVFARHDGCYRSYVYRGRRFPVLPMNKVAYKNREFLVFPDQWLSLVYGDWRVPKRPGRYAEGVNLGMRPACGILPMTNEVRIFQDSSSVRGQGSTKWVTHEQEQ